MITDEQQTQELIIRNEYLDTLIQNLRNKINILQNEKKENNVIIRKKCKHKWVRQRDYEFHNEKIYQCEKCNNVY
jgi:hypothetical protein